MSHKSSTRQPLQKQPGVDGLGRGHGKTVTKAELELLRQKIADLISKDPAKAATLVTHWIHGKKSP
jgi:hypothetical protein